MPSRCRRTDKRKSAADERSKNAAIVSRTHDLNNKAATLIVIDTSDSSDNGEPEIRQWPSLDHRKRSPGKRTAHKSAFMSADRSPVSEHVNPARPTEDRGARDSTEYDTKKYSATKRSPSNKPKLQTARTRERSRSLQSSCGGEGNSPVGTQRMSSTGKRRLQPNYVGSIGKTANETMSKSDANVTIPTDQVEGAVSSPKKRKMGQTDLTTLESVERPCTPTVFHEDKIVTIEFLQSHCWVCKKRVRKLDGHAAFYAMHVHPILRVPCCLVCCDELEAMDVPDDQDDLEQCCACAATEEGGALLLCDVCNNGFCETCTAQAWGGGPAGVQHVQRLIGDDSRSWACIQCNPPFPLAALQIPNDTAAASSFEHGGENSDNESVAKGIVAELNIVEDDLEHCDQLLEDDNVLRLEAEVRKELSETIRSPDEIERLVVQEIDSWKTMHMEHIIRVQDYKVDLLERLNRCGISDDQFYKYRDEGKPKVPSPEDSEWRRRADAEIQKRIEVENARALQQRKLEEKRRAKQEDDPCDSDAEEKHALAAVEDLCTSFQPEDWETEELLDSRRQWKAHGSESREYIEKKLNQYMARDDEQLKNAGSCVVQIDKESDDKAVQKEFALASSNSSCGTRIRRDTIQAILIRKKNGPKPSLPGERNGAEGFASVTRGLVSPSWSKRRGLSDFPDKIGSSPSGLGVLKKSRVGLDSNKALEGDEIGNTMEPEPCSHGPVWDSCVELCSEDEGKGTRSVRVARELASKLKPHQVDGIKFMWQNSCKDLSTVTTREEALEERDVGGCILAHMMGLGKTLQVITLMHTLLHHPALREPHAENPKPFLQKILLIVPVNTIANWINEFDKWTGKLQHSVRYFDYSSVTTSNRPRIVQNWWKLGGVLLIGAEAFTRLAKKEKDATLFHDPGPDVVFIDEAHTLLKTHSSEISKALDPMKTKRRITLSGTPFVNNLKEYFKLSDWCRPGSLGTFAQFDRMFVQKIMAGLASDSTTQQVAEQVRTSKLLFNTMAPFMQRRGASYLTKDLPPSQTAVFYIRQSKLQSRLYRSFERYAKRLAGPDKLSFISHYQMIRPLHNHPYCLIPQTMGGANGKAQEENDDTGRVLATASVDVGAESGAEMHSERLNDVPTVLATQVNSESHSGITDKVSRGRRQLEYPWIQSALSLNDKSKLSSVRHGNKIFLLLQILANADAVGDKVVVFSQCLRTLDFIEKVLGTSDWARFCKGHERKPGLGSWKKGIDYLRIDGSVNSSQRGDLVTSFHEELGGIKAFLLSIEAGGIGINLVAANRVVIFDNHWNPTVSSQAFHRCYRYGQEKPVFGYRFITQGSMEEKIYKRSMNKSGIAARVIDQQFPERSFTDREIAEIQSIDTWVQCDSCEKWRILFLKSEEDLPEKWYCKDNNDLLNKACSVRERNAEWYEKNRKRILDLIEQQSDEKPSLADSFDPGSSEEADETKKSLVMKDSILLAMGLLNLFDKSKLDSNHATKGTSTSVISEIQFQEMLLVESGDLAIEASHTEAEAAAVAEEAVTVAINESEFLRSSSDLNFSAHQEPHHQTQALTQTLSSKKPAIAATATSTTCEAPIIVDGSMLKFTGDLECQKALTQYRINEAEIDVKKSTEALRLEQVTPSAAESDVRSENKRALEKLISADCRNAVEASRRDLAQMNTGTTSGDAIELIDSDDEGMSL